MQNSLIVLTSLLTWSVLQVSFVAGATHVRAFEAVIYNDKSPALTAPQAPPAPVALGGTDWQIAEADTVRQVCEFEFVTPLKNAVISHAGGALDSRACVAARESWVTPAAGVQVRTGHWSGHASSTAGYQTISHEPDAPTGTPVPAPTPVSTPAPTAAPSADPSAPLSPDYWGVTPLPMEGLAMYYNPGVMQRVIEYRERMGEIQACGDCVGYAALLRAGDLNRKIWIRWTDGTVEGPFLVVDVAAPQHVEMLIRRGWAVDVDNRTAVRHGMNRPVAVTIYGAPPALTYAPPQTE